MSRIDENRDMGHSTRKPTLWTLRNVLDIKLDPEKLRSRHSKSSRTHCLWKRTHIINCTLSKLLITFNTFNTAAVDELAHDKQFIPLPHLNPTLKHINPIPLTDTIIMMPLQYMTFEQIVRKGEIAL